MARRLTTPFERGSDSVILSLSTTNPTTATAAAYDFREHQAKFNHIPDPRYLLVARLDIPVSTTVTVEYQFPGTGGVITSGTTVQVVETGVLAGSSFLINLQANEGPETRIRRLVVSPAPPDGAPAAWWDVVALLGNLSKLLWIIGSESDHLYRQLEVVRSQRRLANATGRSLDLLGFDLGVPRFPQLPYSFDPDTIALYHLDDAPGAVPAVENIIGQYTPPAAAKHHGSNPGNLVIPGVLGRFNQGFAFRNPNAEIDIPDHADFNPGPGNSFTIECFIKPDVGAGDGHVLSKHADPANLALRGWALSVGDFGRGVPLNARLLLTDGTNRITLFGDEPLDTARFTHLAGAIDRTTQEARLYVNGVFHAGASISALGALANVEPVRIGRTGAEPFRGTVDEVRFSRAARTRFHSVLGESDESYRRRLRIFDRWTLPTPADLRRILNEACGPINGDTEPLTISDENATLVGGSRFLNIFPSGLALGASVDSLGRARVKEADVNGTPSGDDLFDITYLITHNDPRAVYHPAPPRTLNTNEPAPDSHKMHVAAGRTLTGLLNLLASEAAVGSLHVESAFDPRTSDLRAVGRGLLLRHDSVSLSHLGVLAHRAGFSFVSRPSTLNSVYASVTQAEFLEVNVVPGGTTTGADGFDLRVGETLNLAVRPVPLADTVFEWRTASCGAGRALFNTRTDRPTVTIQASAPGSLTVKVEALRRHRIVSGTRVFKIGLAELPDNQTIGGDGTLGVLPTTVTRSRDAFFHNSYLVTHESPRVTYGDIHTRRMHPSVAQRLDRLMALTAPLGAGGGISISQAIVPGATDLSGVGLTLTIRPTNLAALPTGRLAALAHSAGFTYVHRSGNQVLLRQAEEELMTVTAQPDVYNIVEGGSLTLTSLPQAGPSAIAVTANSVFIANRSSDTVTEMDRATQEIRRVLKVGWAPVDIAISNDGLRVFTADSRSNTISAITLATGTVDILTATQGPSAVVHHPTTAQLYVTGFAANQIMRFNSTTLTPLGSIAVSPGPVAAAITPATDELWVLSRLSRRINIFAASTLTAITTIALVDEPGAIAIAPDGARAYITVPAAGLIRIIDVPGRTMVGQFSSGGTPSAIAIAPDGFRLYVTNSQPGTERLQVFEIQSAAPFLIDRGTVRVRRQPSDVVATANAVYVANQASNVVSLIQPLPAPIRVAQNWYLGSGLGEQLTWVLRPESQAAARINNTSEAETRFLAEHAGRVLIRPVHSSRLTPYTFEVRLKPALETAGAIITKAQYDLIMNALNAFHPIGVEVITRAIRERVIEVRQGLLSAFPDYTYPNFRVSNFPRMRRLR
jgi:DNA-binding beta-propeller fold protein YncE